jgi:FtsH-binding integral membrane protein
MTQAIIDVIAVLLTLMVLSRIIGDNPLFRIAQYIFVGVSLGVAFVVAYQQVIRPGVSALISGQSNATMLYAIPLAMGLMLFPRITRRQSFSWVANIPLALVFGVGSALAVGGAVAGTLAPQIFDTAARPLSGSPDQVVGVVVLALGTVMTLSTFYYTAPRDGASGRLIALFSMIGHWFLMVAFGFFFASAMQTYLSALTERLSFILDWVMQLFT